MKCSVFFEVRTEFLNVIYTSFSFRGLIKYNGCVPDENRDLNGHPEDDIKRQRTQYNGDQLYSNVSRLRYKIHYLSYNEYSVSANLKRYLAIQFSRTSPTYGHF
jgi:hypothetical protein